MHPFASRLHAAIGNLAVVVGLLLAVYGTLVVAPNVRALPEMAHGPLFPYAQYAYTFPTLAAVFLVVLVTVFRYGRRRTWKLVSHIGTTYLILSVVTQATVHRSVSDGYDRVIRAMPACAIPPGSVIRSLGSRLSEISLPDGRLCILPSTELRAFREGDTLPLAFQGLEPKPTAFTLTP